MAVLTETTVREAALKHPSSPAVLENLGIDYCCGGQLPFDAACLRAGHTPEAVREQLRQAAAESAARQQDDVDWTRRPLGELITHIEQTHHAFVRSEVPRLTKLIAKVAAAHGAARPAWIQVQQLFLDLAGELLQHLLKEEKILFPYVRQQERHRREGAAAPAEACFGSVQNPIRMMVHEHDSAGAALRQLRALTNDYDLVPTDCTSTRTLLEALPAFAADLYRHIHLENNILFPRAVELEQLR